jgi:hypothetical protein
MIMVAAQIASQDEAGPDINHVRAGETTAPGADRLRRCIDRFAPLNDEQPGYGNRCR